MHLSEWLRTPESWDWITDGWACPLYGAAGCMRLVSAVLAQVLSGLHERAVRHKSQAQSKIFPIGTHVLLRIDISITVPVRDISLRDH